MTGTEIVRRTSLQDKLTYAEKLAESGLLPVAYRRQPANVLYATEYGEMLGLAPLAAINGLHIIEGKPTASAGMVSALVRQAGHRLRSGYDAKTRTGWCEIVRSDDPDFTYRAEWTIDRAVIAGLCTIKDGRPFSRDSKGKPKPWERYPEAMMKARAITECARDACEEVLNGVHYTPEELGADVDESGEPIKVTAERVYEPPTNATTLGPEQAPSKALDWDALLADAQGNPDALRDLWALAGEHEPNNTALFERIKDAGTKAAAAAEAAIAAKAKEAEPVDAEIVDEHPAPPADESGPVNQAQLIHLAALCTEHGVKDRGHRLALLSKVGDKRLTSMKDLTFAEGSKLIDTFHYLVRTQRIATVVTEAAKHAHEFPAEGTPVEEITAPDNSQES